MIRIVVSVVVLMVAASAVQAQRPGGRQGLPERPFEGSAGPPGFHLITALDVDKDGKISTKEIENATAALKKLDKNKDGKLSQQEIGWPPTFGGGGNRGGFRGGGFGGDRARGRGGFSRFGGGGSQGGQAGGRPQRPQSEQPSQEKPGPSAFFSADQFQRLDRNGDGKLTTPEIPKFMQTIVLRRVDANKDGVVEKAEWMKLAKAKAKPK